MRILLLNDDFPPKGQGGGATVVRDLARGYAKEGHDVTVITTHQDSHLIERRGEDAITVISLPIRYRSSFRWYLSLWNPRASKLLLQALTSLPPFDAVHIHNIHHYLTYASIRIVKKRARRIVMTFHDVMSVSCARLTTKRYLKSKPPAFDYRITMVDRMKQCGWTWNPFRNVFIRSALTRVDTKICVSQALKDCLETNGISCNGVIHNGIDCEVMQPDESKKDEVRRRLQLTDKKAIFFGGRLSADKGFEELMQAFRTIKQEHSEVSILVAGDEKRIARIVTPEDQALILFTGWLDRPDLLALMSIAALIVTPSVCFDSFPTLNLEAMSLGKPVIATQFGGSSELVIDRETGFIVDPHDTMQFADRMKRLLDDPLLIKRMGQAGQARVATSFTLRKQVERYVQLFS